MIISLRTRTCNVRIYQVRKQSPPFIHRLVNSYPILIPDKNSTEASSILKRVFACIRIYPKKKKILIDPRNLCQENGYIFFTTCRITLKFLMYGFSDILIAVCTKNGRKIRRSYPSVTKDFLSIFLARQQQKGPSVPTDKTFVCKHFVHRFFFFVGGHLFIFYHDLLNLLTTCKGSSTLTQTLYTDIYLFVQNEFSTMSATLRQHEI